jgi:Fe-Mn family superoxide dismutase
MTARGKETVGNFEVNGEDVVTRREVLLMGAIAAGGLVAVSPAKAAEPAALATATPAGGELYAVKDFAHLVKKNMSGLSSSQIEQHIKLYKGYVGKCNDITAKLKDAETAGANATYSPFRELLVEKSYALNGAVYHEYYFGNLGGAGGEPGGELKAAIDENWGGYGKFVDQVKAAGKSMRGWVIVGYNTRDGKLETFGLDLHNMFVPANVIPVLVLDVYEHAYMIDYGTDRGKYLDAFFNNIDWEVVAKRLVATRKHPVGLDSTV